MHGAAASAFQDIAFIFVAAVAGALFARWLKQPLILGYVLGGIIISPFTFGPSVSDVHRLEIVAEVGVILLMFSIGLDFHLKDLIRFRWVAMLGAPLGMIAMIGLGVLAGISFGWPMNQSLVVGAVISVCSTMVLARFLMEHGELRTHRGRIMIAIALVEDIAVVILTVLIAALGSPTANVWQGLGISLLKAVALLVPLGFVATRLVPPLLRRVMRIHSPELFLIIILALCLSTAAVTQAIGLSLALGAFLAGIVLSGSDYAREALGSLLPLRDAFVALFFVTIGMLMDPKAIVADPTLLLVMVVLIIGGSLTVWTLVVRMFGYPLVTALSVGVGLAQIGEFSFILVQVARASRLIPDNVYNATLAAALLTITINGALWKYAVPAVDRRRARSLGKYTEPLPEAEAMRDHVVICGFGRMGGPAGAAFETFKVPYLIIEIDPDVVANARKHGQPCMFGDPVHTAVLEAAHVERASLVLVTLPEPDRAYLAIKNIRRLAPEVTLIARAHRRADFELLKQAGATVIVQPETEAGATMIAESLHHLGISDEETYAYMENYRTAMNLAQPRLQGRPYSLPELRDLAVSKIGAAGKMLRDSKLREEFGLNVVRIRKANGSPIFNPAADTILDDGDTIEVLGLEDQLDRVGAVRRAT